MQPPLRPKIIGTTAIFCFLAACAQEEAGVPVGVDSDSDVATGGDLVINVTWDAGLENAVSLVFAIGAKPGAQNPVETHITIRNETAQQQILQTKGDWYDTRGNGYGGSSETLTIAAGQTYTIYSGTRSTGVTGYRLFLTQDIQSEDELYAAPTVLRQETRSIGLRWSRIRNCR